MINALLRRLHRGAEATGRALLPDARRVRIERRVRGYLEYRRLMGADAAVVSFGKSGRTWLRVMLSRYYAVRYALPGDMLLEYDNMHRRDARVPRMLFTHDNYLGDWTGHGRDKSDYAGRRTVLLVRDPVDTAVSQYFQWAHRMRPHKKLLNRYPPDGAPIDLYGFVMGEQGGVPWIVRFLNDWARAFERLDHALLVRYEDLRADPADELARLLGFLGEPRDAEAVADAVDYASFERMRAREQSGETQSAHAGRLAAADPGNPDSFKARRGKVGGYRDYLTPEQVRTVDAYVNTHLDPVFGYQRENGDAGAAPEAPPASGGPAR